MKYRTPAVILLFILFAASVNAQSLKTGFDASEYNDMLVLAEWQYYNKDVWIHHGLAPYKYLAGKIYSVPGQPVLRGN